MFHAKGFHGMMLFLTIVAAALAALLFTASGTAACAQEEGVRLPIVMYHDLTNNPADQDDYTLSLEQLEQDLIAFEEHGFTPVPTEATEMFHILKNAENPHFYGFRLHTFRTTDKVIRYGINNQFDFAEHPAVIQRGEKRTINICVAVPDVA